MNMITTALRRLFAKGEGERIQGPLARVMVPEQGWLPMSWPLNFWQCGYNVLPGGDNAIVEACIWAYIRAIAQLPGFHRRDLENGGVETITTSSLSRLLRSPNFYETSSDYLIHLVRSLLLNGNSYWPAERNERNEVVALHWTNPNQCRVHEITVEGQLTKEVFYSIGDNPLLTFDDMRDAIFIPARDVLHFKLATPRHPLIGETWLNALMLELLNRGAINLSSSAFFQNMARPSGVLQTDLVLTKAQVDELRDRWNEQSRGMNAGGTPILTAGLKFEPITMSSHDAQIIEALKLNDRTIAGVFGVPAILIGIAEGGAPVKTAEAVMTEWLASGLGFLINHIEVQIDKFIGLPRGEYTEYDTQALLRSLFRERIEGLARGVQSGIFAPNEARKAEGLRAVKDGDEPRVQQQVVPLSFGADLAPPAPKPAAPAEPPPAADDEKDLGEEARQVVGTIFKQLTRGKADEHLAA